MEYRIANEGDIDSIIALWNESRVYHEDLDSRLRMVENAGEIVKGYVKEQMEAENTVFYLALKDKTPIGYICAQIQKRPPVFEVPQIGFIDGLFVKGDSRRWAAGHCATAAAGNNQSLAEHRQLHIGGLVPGDDPSSYKRFYKRKPGSPARAEGERDHRSPDTRRYGDPGLQRYQASR